MNQESIEVTPTPARQIIKAGEVKPFNPQEDVERAKQAATALMGIIKQKKSPVLMNGEQYLEFEDWQTIGQFFTHTTGTEWTKPVMQDGKVMGYEAKANLYNKDGLVVGGAEASCLRDELNWQSKPDFQLRSMAQTRAMAKALRSRFGFVAVLAGFRPTPAEEITVETKETKKDSKPSDKQIDYIKNLCQQKGYSKEDIIDQGFTKLDRSTARELIDWLLKAPTKITPNGDPVSEYEPNPELEKLAEETPF